MVLTAQPAWSLSFEDQIQPLFAKYCYDCHGNDDASRKADLNLEYFQTGASLAAMPDLLEDALFFIEEGEMPPAKYAHQPTSTEKALIVNWLDDYLHQLETASRNDPGHVVAPRLNHLEYDRVVSDLTGVTIEIAHLFPRDSGAGEGFTNVGEAQQADVAYLQNWLDAGRFVASHARITPLRGIRWLPEPQPAAPDQTSMLAALASDWALWHAEQEKKQTKEYFEQFRRPKPEGSDYKHAKVSYVHEPYFYQAWRYHHRAALGRPDITFDEIAHLAEPTLYPSILEDYYTLLSTDPTQHEQAKDPVFAELAQRWQALPPPAEADPEGIREKTTALTDWLYSSKAHEGAVKNLTRRSRSDFSGNSYTPFAPYPGFDMNLFATEQEQRSGRAARQPRPFYLMAEDMRRNASEEDRQALERLIEEVNQVLEPNLEQEAELARQILGELTPYAWRRPVQPAELDRLLQPYHSARSEGATLDHAVKASLTALLVSPEFLFRLRNHAPEPVTPLEPLELASRLSFALWGTIPDDALLKAAVSGSLRQPDGYKAEVARMLVDPKARFLADQFAGQWLHFSRFAEKAQPDLERYPDFTPEIAADMEESLVRFFASLIRENRPVTELVTARSLPMSNRLAEYYDLIDPPEWRDNSGQWEEWRSFDLPRGHRGILSSGPITVGHSQPLRTSPIKRGAWIVIELLGTPMPEPPPNIPPISDDEVSPEGLTVAEQMELHRKDPACFSCHQKLDPMGLALENFDPAGRWRETDTAGNPVVNSALSPEGNPIEGLDGLVDYLSQPEKTEAIARQFSHKLLGYLLGRAIGIGDRETIDAMADAMRESNWRVQPAFEVALSSPQFLNKRNSAPAATTASAQLD